MESTKFQSCFDDKIRILNNRYDGLALGYFNFWSNQNSIFVKL